jgi:hypothetical protein
MTEHDLIDAERLAERPVRLDSIEERIGAVSTVAHMQATITRLVAEVRRQQRSIDRQNAGVR